MNCSPLICLALSLPGLAAFIALAYVVCRARSWPGSWF